MDLASFDVDPVEETGRRVPKTSFAQLVLACDVGFSEGDLFGGHWEKVELIWRKRRCPGSCIMNELAVERDSTGMAGMERVEPRTDIESPYCRRLTNSGHAVMP